MISCWRNHPENIRPQVNPGDGQVHSGRLANPPTIFRSGNHVNILTDDGKIVLLAHLKTGTVPESVCPFDDEFVTNANNKVNGFPVEGIIPEADRPVVVQGQFIGRVGNSGAASLPHLHIHMKPVTDDSVDPPDSGDSEPFNFHGVYTKLQDPMGDFPLDWMPLEGESLPDSELIFPSSFLRMGSFEDEPIFETTTLGLAGIGSVTATQNEAGNLQISTYTVDEVGEVDLKDSEEAGFATQIAVARPGLTRDIVTALRSASGNLKLIGWDFSVNGNITRKGEAEAGAVSKIAIAPTPGGSLGIVTAVRDGSGLLKLITWKVDNTLGTIERIDEASGVAITDVAVTPIQDGRALGNDFGLPFTGVVTASRDAAGKLRLDAWEMGSDLHIVHRGFKVGELASETQIATVRTDNLHEALVTGVRNAQGSLTLTSWQVTANGNFAALDNAAAGGILDVQLVDGGLSDVIGALRDANGNLRLMVWRVLENGRVERHGETLAGQVGKISVTPPTGIDGDKYVVGSFQLLPGAAQKIIAWKFTM